MPLPPLLAVSATILLAGLSLVACTAEPAPLPSATAPESAEPSGRVAYLLETATGPAEFSAPDPEAPGVEFSITCAPDSEFSIQVNNEANFFAGVCGADARSATIPVESASGDVRIEVVVPAGTTFTVVGSPAN